MLSGAAALVYELLWLRLLTLWMGHTTAAIGTILAAFMGGLALGAWMGGRLAPALSPLRALRRYAWLEVTIAVYAILLPLALTIAPSLLRNVYADGDGGMPFTFVRVALSLLLLLVPTTAMGATYPLAVRWFGGHAAGAGGVYAANTAGAALGIVLGAFVLLPFLGMRGSTYAASGLNLLAAGGALLLSRRNVEALDRGADTVSTPDAEATIPALPLAAAALLVSGFVALVYEVTWTRILAMVLGPTTYAFSAMLLAFVTGLAIGSAAASALLPRTRHAGAWLGGTLIAAATIALTTSIFVDRLPVLMATASSARSATFGSVMSLQIAVGIAMQLPTTVALGAAFPFAVALTGASGRHTPRAVSIVYASNTLGAIAGALTGSFVLIPALGLETSLRLTAAITIVTGLFVCWQTMGRGAGRGVATIVTAAGLVAVFLLPSWNHERLANGGYRYAPGLSAGDIATGLEAGRLLYYREGAAGTVSVRELPGARSLSIDGKVDASNAGDMLTQKLLAHLPLLLHGAARDVLVIGLGSGVTLGSALTHPIAHADVLEISPEVVAASALFQDENRHALADPRTHLVVGDGRSHLLLSRRRYDVIISEPSNPWMAGVAALFTREFFAAARTRLAPGGVLCQWAHTYSISGEDLRSIVATFLDAFPDGSAWLIGESDLLLIGSTAPLTALETGRLPAWDRPAVAADLAAVSMRDAFSLLTLFLTGTDDMRRYAGDAALQSDDRLQLEFSAPRAAHGQFQTANVAALLDQASQARLPAAVAQATNAATPVQWRTRGVMRLRAEAPALAYSDLARAVEGAPHDTEGLDAFAQAAARTGRLDEAQRLLSRVGAQARSAPALVERSKALAALGRNDDATNTAREAALLDPTSRAALRQLATTYADLGDADALAQLARIVAPSEGHRSAWLYAEARLAYLRRDFERAARQLEELVKIADDVDAWNLLGHVRGALGENDRARDAFAASLRIAPRDPAALANLGTSELRLGRAAAATERFQDALFLAPTLAPALDGLEQAYERLGLPRRAAAIRAVPRGQ